MELIIIIFVLSVLYVIFSPFIWAGRQIKYSINEQKLLALVGTNNVSIIKNGTSVIVKLRDKDGAILSLPLGKREEFLSSHFSREYQHACWMERLTTELKHTEKLVWDSLFELAWGALRSLEERDIFTENHSNFVSTQNFGWIERMTDKALVGLLYKSMNAKNDELVTSITADLQRFKQQREKLTDEVHRQSLQVIIDAHNKRLETQMRIKNTITLLDNDIERLRATFKLIIEGVGAEISACKLGNTRIMTKWNDLVLSINLSDLDRVYEEHRPELPT